MHVKNFAVPAKHTCRHSTARPTRVYTRVQQLIQQEIPTMEYTTLLFATDSA